MIFVVIIGYGSDENGCGEFCVISYYFFVNGYINNIIFSEVGISYLYLVLFNNF